MLAICLSSGVVEAVNARRWRSGLNAGRFEIVGGIAT
jgi:hypothetical protein